MPRKKQIKFEQIRIMPNVIEATKPIFKNIKGKWSVYFGNNNPIVLELGCGYGDYTRGLAKQFPNINYIGIDIKGERLWAGANFATENKLNNVAFLQTEIYYLADFFELNEVAEIWITFPDPQLEKPRKRLTNNTFLAIYKQVLRRSGIVHLKTDSDELYNFTSEVLANQKIKPNISTQDLYNSQFQALHHGITTGFEKVYLASGKTIKYLKFQIN